jgi:hypothetical protein
VVPKKLTCTAADQGWSMKLPAIAGAEQQEVVISLQQDSDFSKLFLLNAATNTLTLNPKYEKSIMSGDICPAAGNKLIFELSSNILGKSTKTYDFA